MRKVLAAATMAACVAAGSAVAQTQVERGKYLVESIMGCGNCHTPMRPNGPIMDKALSGGPPIEEGKLFTALPSNITPDPETASASGPTPRSRPPSAKADVHMER
jgi:mono/diheme cytochrome c family protein